MAMKSDGTLRKGRPMVGLRPVENIRASYRKNPELVCPTKGRGMAVCVPTGRRGLRARDSVNWYNEAALRVDCQA